MSEAARLLASLDEAARTFDDAARAAAARRGWDAVEQPVNHVAKLAALFYAQAIAGARSASGRPPLTAPTTEFVNIPPELDGILGGAAIIATAAAGLREEELHLPFTSFDSAVHTVRELLVAAAEHYGTHLQELGPAVPGGSTAL